MWGANAAAEPLLRNPTTGIAGCCACAASGQVITAPPKSVMNSRRRIEPPRGMPHRCLKPSTLRGRRVRKGEQLASDAATECPKWVTSDGLAPLATGPLYPPTADVGADIQTDAECHER